MLAAADVALRALDRIIAKGTMKAGEDEPVEIAGEPEDAMAVVEQEHD